MSVKVRAIATATSLISGGSVQDMMYVDTKLRDLAQLTDEAIQRLETQSFQMQRNITDVEDVDEATLTDVRCPTSSCTHGHCTRRRVMCPFALSSPRSPGRTRRRRGVQIRPRDGGDIGTLGLFAGAKAAAGAAEGTAADAQISDQGP
jgi:hypothetical protein